MICCSECEYLALWPDRISVRWPIKRKTLYSCVVHQTDNGTSTMWKKIPKTHPHWCPKYKEGKQ